MNYFMKAMILAAGRGERMQSYTNTIPKPLLTVNGVSLLERNLWQLKSAGVSSVVINVCYLAEQIIEKIGDGSAYGLQVAYSIERDGLLDTGGGIRHALPLLGESPFLVLSSDIWTDYPFSRLVSKTIADAHLVLVDNPDYHPRGDFGLSGDRVTQSDQQMITYANIAVLHPRLFSPYDQTVFPLSRVLRDAIAAGVVTGERYTGTWFNVGTPEVLEELDKKSNASSNHERYV